MRPSQKLMQEMPLNDLRLRLRAINESQPKTLEIQKGKSMDAQS